MLVSLSVSAAELDSSDTFILLQGFPTSASTENAWARELRPCIVAKDPDFLRSDWTLTLSRSRVSVRAHSAQKQQQQQRRQHLREPLFSHGGSLTLRNWSSALPCVLRDARPHPKSLIIGTPLLLTTISPPLSHLFFSVSPLLLSVPQWACAFGSTPRVTGREREGGKSAACIPPHGPALQKMSMLAFTPDSHLNSLRQMRNRGCCKSEIKTYFYFLILNLSQSFFNLSFRNHFESKWGRLHHRIQQV